MLKGKIEWLIARRAVKAVVMVAVSAAIAAGLVEAQIVQDLAAWLAEAAAGAPAPTLSGS